MEKEIFIIDTSAILSGKPLNFLDQTIITVSGVTNELREGGKDYQNFQFLKEKGLKIMDPSLLSIQYITKTAQQTGDKQKLSSTDIQILALAFELHKKNSTTVTILTDDYSIQNIATTLHLPFTTITQKGIQKKFQWYNQCRGCRKKFSDPIKICPICGSQTKLSHKQKK
jgi:endoribonuclease Nob1